MTPYTSFLAVPRALLRPRVIRPGDPVLRVKTDESIVSVVALFPFGLVQPLRYLSSEDIWQTRFLAPTDMQDGTYTVRLILRDRAGHTYRESKTFVIASKPPVVKMKLDAQTLPARPGHCPESPARRRARARWSRGWKARRRLSCGGIRGPPRILASLLIPEADDPRYLQADGYRRGHRPQHRYARRCRLKCFLDSCRRRTAGLRCCVGLASLDASPRAPNCRPGFATSKPRSAMEAVFFRMMSLPGGAVLFRRPPRETRPALGDLIKRQPRNAELYSLRASEDEQQLDFTAAESDWKSLRRSCFRQDRRPACPGRFLSPPPAARGRNQDAVVGCQRCAHGIRKTHAYPHSSVPGRRLSASSA